MTPGPFVPASRLVVSLRGRAAAAAARAGGVHTAVARCSLRAQHSIPSSRAVTGGPCWCPKVPCMQSLNQVLGASGGRWVAQKPSKCALQCQLPCCPVSSYSTWPGSAVLPVPLCTQPDSCKHAQTHVYDRPSAVRRFRCTFFPAGWQARVCKQGSCRQQQGLGRGRLGEYQVSNWGDRGCSGQLSSMSLQASRMTLNEWGCVEGQQERAGA